MSFLQDVFSTLLDQRRIFQSEKDKRSIGELCAALMSEQGEVSGTKVASSVLAKYEALSHEEKANFFNDLAKGYDLDVESVIEAAQGYAAARTRPALERLTQVSEPKRQELFRRLNQVPGATEKLVHMREDLFPLLKTQPEYAVIDSDFEHLFDTWFNRGFLLLKPIDWRTPANILEKIIEYEAVHAINDWDDLQRRLQPSDRRCFGFFHPVMPEEPLIFVEVALTKGVPASIESLLTENRDVLPENEADTAVFYSISNCQNGLRGVSFGNFLIKQVAEDLSAEVPNIKNFVTLSPVPGFTKWLRKQELTDERAPLQELVDAPDLDADKLEPHGKFLMILMAKYMTEAKRDDGFPVDPVSRFHLGNGASLERINWMADLSENGLKQSLGMMVNYRYALGSVESNHESYVKDKQVHTTKEVIALARG
ncbi:MAG: malonyl-CoA decarboxylase [Rhizobiaceae bacterium]|nr:malonyl-CoA decarboxylase [Rhizobiaceae bacterium]